MKFTIIAAVLAATLAGCSSTVRNTNREAGVPVPSIASTDSVAKVTVGEMVRGEGCAKEFLILFKSGDNKFLQIHGNSGSSAVDRAKAAATWKALTKDKGLSTDIIVQPTWEITHDKTFFGLIANDVCAKVVGYRGVIENFRPADTMTKPAEKTQAPASKFFGWLKFEQN